MPGGIFVSVFYFFFNNPLSGHCLQSKDNLFTEDLYARQSVRYGKPSTITAPASVSGSTTPDMGPKNIVYQGHISATGSLANESVGEVPDDSILPADATELESEARDRVDVMISALYITLLNI